MEDDLPSNGAVLPLDPDEANVALTDPWRLLVEHRAMLVTWTESVERDPGRWGPALQGSSALARQLGGIVEQAGQGRLVSTGAGTLFRLELPSGTTLQNLVPAVGGGFRGLVRSGGAPQIAGHVRLLPAVGAAGAVGAGVALGPLVALMALAVGSEMLARHQQDKKLKAIQGGVDALRHYQDETVVAQLDSAQQALELSSAAILDRSDVPSSIGLGAARDNLRVIKNRALGWLDGWEEGVAHVKPGKTGIDYSLMRKLLAGKGNTEDSYKRFPRRVEWLYRALALDSRAIVLTGAEASMKRDLSLSHLESQLRSGLNANADAQERLRRVLWELAAENIGYRPPSMPRTSSEVATLHRSLGALAIAASTMPDAPPLLNMRFQQITEVLRASDGTLRVLTPVDRSERPA